MKSFHLIMYKMKKIYGLHLCVCVHKCVYLQVRSRSRSSSVSLTVETALGSFDFLNTSDLEEEEEEEDDERQNVTDRSELEKCLTFLLSRGIL